MMIINLYSERGDLAKSCDHQWEAEYGNSYYSKK